MVTINETPDGFRVLINGTQLRLLFTRETGRPAVQRFAELVQLQAEQILAAHNASEAKRQLNYANPGQGRNWPEFRTYEKLLNRLQAEAGIKDS